MKLAELKRTIKAGQVWEFIWSRGTFEKAPIRRKVVKVTTQKVVFETNSITKETSSLYFPKAKDFLSEDDKSFTVMSFNDIKLKYKRVS